MRLSKASPALIMFILLLGCHVPFDPCDDQAGSCLTVRLRGDVGNLDSVQIDLHGAVEYRYREHTPSEVLGLPAVVGVLLPEHAQGGLSVAAAALLAGHFVGMGSASADLVPGQHLELLLELTRVDDNPSCSDGIRNGNESDADCGGGCDRCPQGKICGRSQDCMSGVCQQNQCVSPSDPEDPARAGLYRAATMTLTNPPAGLAAQTLLLPSDDASTISSRQLRYPLVLVAPAKGMPLASMRPYADRLVSHGFIVGGYQVFDESNDTSYRDTGLAYLNTILNSAIQSRIDSARIGLFGYQLSAKISVAMAVHTQTPVISGLFLIAPVELFSANGQIDTIAITGQLQLPNSASLAMLVEPRSTVGSSPCVQPPQKGYADFFAAARSPAFAINFAGANLGDFVEAYPDALCTAGSTVPQAQTQALAAKYATAYFKWTLNGMLRQREYLLGDDFLVDAQAAMLTRSLK